METLNAAYRLMNPNSGAPGSDQNFIVGGNEGDKHANQDSEVAKITQNDPNLNNIVHLKDPKHIKGFGSNVVHVNVSCGQTLPENKSKCSQAKDQDSKQPATDKAKPDNKAAPVGTTEEEEDDA